MPSLRSIHETWRYRGPPTHMGPTNRYPTPGWLQFFYFIAYIHQVWTKISSLPFQLFWPRWLPFDGLFGFRIYWYDVAPDGRDVNSSDRKVVYLYQEEDTKWTRRRMKCSMVYSTGPWQLEEPVSMKAVQCLSSNGRMLRPNGRRSWILYRTLRRVLSC